jgi:hydrogenase-4 component F
VFLIVGQHHQKYDTKHISKIKGVLKLLPVSGTAIFSWAFCHSWGRALSDFGSELSMVASVFEAKHYWIGLVIVFSLQ